MKDSVYLMRPQEYIDGLVDLIGHVNLEYPTKQMDMIEIGSYAGESTEIFCMFFKSIVAIDPYIDNYDPTDVTCSYAPMSVVFGHFQNRMKNFDNVFLIKATSDSAAKHLIMKPVDFIYIDGMHTYEQIKKDITNYLPFVKKGGFIAGHDYHEKYQGVIDAVHELLGKPDKVFKDTSWVKQIK